MEIRRNFYSLDGKPYGLYILSVNHINLLDSYFYYLEGEYCWAFLQNQADSECDDIYTYRPNRFYIKFELEDLDGHHTLYYS